MKKSSNTSAVQDDFETRCPICQNKSIIYELRDYQNPVCRCQKCGHEFYSLTPEINIPITPIYEEPKKVGVGRYGWECPKCGAVMSPDQVTCVNCRGEGWNKWT